MADPQDPQNSINRIEKVLPPVDSPADYGSYLESLASDILSQAPEPVTPPSIQPPATPASVQRSLGDLRSFIQSAATTPYPISRVEELSATPAETPVSTLGKADLLATAVKEPAKIR